jgi:hypothetical protein
LQLWALLSSGAPVAPLGMFCPVVDKAVATAMLAFLYIPTVIFAAAFLFAAVERLEPNRRLAIVFKCAILAAGGAAIAKQLLP